ncbi:MAG: hypothetical protein M3M97_02710 [Actinomycetota bacterium]|nr:hypothetical protein [Actinomycetota bacterium]
MESNSTQQRSLLMALLYAGVVLFGLYLAWKFLAGVLANELGSGTWRMARRRKRRRARRRRISGLG